MAFHADAYCSYYLADICEAAESASRAVAGFARSELIGELAQAYTGLGNCLVASCRFEEARRAYDQALVLSEKIGDDCRSSIVLSNVGASYFLEGNAETALKYCLRSLAVGKRAPAQPSLLRTWSNLAAAYAATGELSKARESLDAWGKWMKDGRSWAGRMEFYCHSASMELTLGNTDEALKWILTAERESQGAENLVVTQGRLERLRVFSTYHTSGAHSAEVVAMANLDHSGIDTSLPTRRRALRLAERKVHGSISQSTREELGLFERLRLAGKHASLVMEGALE
jgi:tetratricopeptide (TPR) repeat protein